MGESRETWLIASHASNMNGRAASHTITDKIPQLVSSGVFLWRVPQFLAFALEPTEWARAHF
jgi:hypothetical protein